MRRNYFLIIIFIVAFLGGALMIKNKTKKEDLPVAAAVGTSSASSSEVKNVIIVKDAEKPASKKIETIDKLPTVESLRKLTEDEIHHTPAAIIEGGKLIGRMIEQAHRDPALREETVKVLHECAQSENVATAIRAVCWKNTLTHIEKWKVFVPVSQSRIPPRVLELSSKLP